MIISSIFVLVTAFLAHFFHCVDVAHMTTTVVKDRYLFEKYFDSSMDDLLKMGAFKMKHTIHHYTSLFFLLASVVTLCRMLITHILPML